MQLNYQKMDIIKILEGPRYNMYADEMKTYKQQSDQIKHRRSRSNKPTSLSVQNRRAQPNYNLNIPHFIPVGNDVRGTTSAGLLIEAARMV